MLPMRLSDATPDASKKRVSYAPLTLLQRSASMWMLAVISAAFLLIRLVETELGVIEPHDRYAYPLLTAWFFGLFLLLWRRPQTLPWTTGLGVAGGAAYLAFSAAFVLLNGDRPPGVYFVSTLLQWIPVMWLLAFCTWPLRMAVAICATLFVCVAGSALWLQLSTRGGPQWEQTLWPVFINAFISQIMFVLIMLGLGPLRRGITQMTGDAPPGGVAHEALEAWLQQRTRDIERSRAEAEAASLAKSRFLAVMSHELRTPLNAVLGAAELLRDEPSAGAKQEALISTIAGSGTHLLGLIEQVLDLSRIEAGSLVVEQRVFDVRACANDALKSVAGRAAEKGLALKSEVSLGRTDLREGDDLRLRQVLINLLANAVKFTETGEVQLRVCAASAQGWLEFSVHDTGPGIAVHEQQRVFDAFHQLDDASTRRHEGAGLGLTISRELVQRLGGRLRLESVPGKGTVMRFELPLKQPDEQAGATASANPEPVDLSGVRVLLVEDDLVNQTLAMEMLVRAGASVIVVEDGEAALGALRDRPFDIVLMDWRMPGMDGLEATRRLRAGDAGPAAATLAVLGLTANAFQEDRAACLEAGMNDVLTKPVERRRLLAAVSDWAARPSATGP